MANNIIVSFVAAEAITEFSLVSVDSDGKVNLTDAATENNCVGIAQRACASGDSVEVLVSGLSRAIAGGAISPETMALLMATTDGKLIAYDAGTDNYSVARAIPNINQTGAVSSDQLQVIFNGPSNLTAVTP